MQGSADSRRRGAELGCNPGKRHAGLIQANGLIDFGLVEALASHGHASVFEDLQDAALAERVLRGELRSGNTVQVVLDECLADGIREPEVQTPGRCVRLLGRRTGRLTCKFGQRYQAPAEVGSRGVAVSEGYTGPVSGPEGPRTHGPGAFCMPAVERHGGARRVRSIPRLARDGRNVPTTARMG